MAAEPTRISAALAKLEISPMRTTKRMVILCPMKLFIATIVLLCVGADKIQTLPAERGDQELIGAKMPPLTFDRWLNTEDKKPLDTSGSVTLYRWWTSECPYCKSTLPGLEKFRQNYADKGLKMVA